MTHAHSAVKMYSDANPNRRQPAKKLGKSAFNYQDYTAERFLHYFHQVSIILRLRPKKVLEIGPGDYTVTDFLRRKGIVVKTLDNDPNLFPDYKGDIRKPLSVPEKFDLVLASEVFEHMDVSWLETILQNLKSVIVNGGYLIVSLPYSTIRLFPPRSDYGKIISCEGRLKTHMPFSYAQPFLTLLRGVYRLSKGQNLRSAFQYFVYPKYPDDNLEVHHWDLGFYPTTIRATRKKFAKYFQVIEEKASVQMNCVFFILKKR